MDNPSISPAEWEVMRVVWSHDYLTSREIIQTLIDILEWKEGTIKSLINRLVQKGFLKQDISKKPYIYFATLSSDEAIQKEMHILLDRSCTKERGNHLAYLIKHEQLSINDCQLLIDLLQDKKQIAPQQIKCHCPKGQCTCHTHRKEILT